MDGTLAQLVDMLSQSRTYISQLEAEVARLRNLVDTQGLQEPNGLYDTLRERDSAIDALQEQVRLKDGQLAEMSAKYDELFARLDSLTSTSTNGHIHAEALAG